MTPAAVGGGSAQRGKCPEGVIVDGTSGKGKVERAFYRNIGRGGDVSMA